MTKKSSEFLRVDVKIFRGFWERSHEGNISVEMCSRECFLKHALPWNSAMCFCCRFTVDIFRRTSLKILWFHFSRSTAPSGTFVWWWTPSPDATAATALLRTPTRKVLKMRSKGWVSIWLRNQKGWVNSWGHYSLLARDYVDSNMRSLFSSSGSCVSNWMYWIAFNIV